MAKKATKQSARGRKQDRARVAGTQSYDVGYESKKTGKSRSAVKKAVKKVGSSRKKVEKALKGRKRCPCRSIYSKLSTALRISADPIDLPDTRAAWKQAIASAGEMLKDIDGSLEPYSE